MTYRKVCLLLEGEVKSFLCLGCVLSVVTAWLRVYGYKREILQVPPLFSPFGLFQKQSFRRSRLTNQIRHTDLQGTLLWGKVCRILVCKTIHHKASEAVWIISASCLWDEVPRRDSPVACISAAILSNCTSFSATLRIVNFNQPLTHKSLPSQSSPSLTHHHFKPVHYHSPLSAACLVAHQNAAPIHLRDWTGGYDGQLSSPLFI